MNSFKTLLTYLPPMCFKTEPSSLDASPYFTVYGRTLADLAMVNSFKVLRKITFKQTQCEGSITYPTKFTKHLIFPYLKLDQNSKGDKKKVKPKHWMLSALFCCSNEKI